MVTEGTTIVKRSTTTSDARARYRDANRRTRTLIADALGVAPDAVTTWDRLAYDVGWLDEGACCVNHRFEFTRELEEIA